MACPSDMSDGQDAEEIGAQRHLIMNCKMADGTSVSIATPCDIRSSLLDHLRTTTSRIRGQRIETRRELSPQHTRA